MCTMKHYNYLRANQQADGLVTQWGDLGQFPILASGQCKHYVMWANAMHDHLSKTTTHSFDQSSIRLLWHSFCFNTEKYWQGCVWSGYLLSKWFSITISSCLLIYYYHYVCSTLLWDVILANEYFCARNVILSDQFLIESYIIWWGAFCGKCVFGRNLHAWLLKNTGYTVLTLAIEIIREWVFAWYYCMHACVMCMGSTICPTTTHYLGKS